MRVIRHERANPNIISSSSTRFFASASSNRSLPRESALRTAGNDGAEDDNLDTRALPSSFCKRPFPGVNCVHAPMRSSCASRLRLASARISSISPARCASTCTFPSLDFGNAFCAARNARRYNRLPSDRNAKSINCERASPIPMSAIEDAHSAPLSSFRIIGWGGGELIYNHVDRSGKCCYNNNVLFLLTRCQPKLQHVYIYIYILDERENCELFKIQQERQKELFKIQQERERRSYSKSSKIEWRRKEQRRR